MSVKLDDNQQKAVNCNDDRILCLAGAGAGKTECMIRRVDRLVKDGVDPTTILVFTFTNAAAAEMKFRYQNLNKSFLQPYFGTFHAYCYKLITSDFMITQKLGYSMAPLVCSEEQEKLYIKKSEELLHLKYTDNPKTASAKKNNEIIEANMKKLLIADNMITYTMMIHFVLELFQNKDEVISKYLTQYTNVIVDEFQDTDREQIDLLNCFQNVHYYFVGDALQNLYSFRGTSNEFIKALSNTPGWTIIKLTHNYRSTKPIVDYANDFAKRYADDSYRVNMETDVKGDQVTVNSYSGSYSELNIIIMDLLPKLLKQSNTALLFRTNKEANYVSRVLHDNGIENGRSNYVEHLTKIITSALDDSYFLSYLADNLSKNMYSDFIRQSTLKGRYTPEDFIQDYGTQYKAKSIYNEVTNIKNIFQTHQNVEDLNDALSNTLHLTIPEECQTTEDILEFLKNYRKEGDIYCGTIHSVKGLEFDNVYVFGVDSYTFRLNNEDMKNLYYVAVTRAKKHLTVYWVV